MANKAKAFKRILSFKTREDEARAEEAGMFGRVVPGKFYYSNAAAHAVINRHIEDLSAFTGESKSYIIEEALRALLPQGETAARYVNRVLFGPTGPDGYTVRNALADIYSDGTDLHSESKQSDMEQVLRFTDKVLREKHVKLAFDPGSLGWLKSTKKTYGLVCDLLECAREKGERDPDWIGFNVKLARSLHEDLSGNIKLLEEVSREARPFGDLSNVDDALMPTDFTRLLLECWEVLKGSPWTYEFLNRLVLACRHWDDTAADRVEFQELCCSLMDPWDAEAGQGDRPRLT